jgi:hypothetical protein
MGGRNANSRFFTDCYHSAAALEAGDGGHQVIPTYSCRLLRQIARLPS